MSDENSDAARAFGDPDAPDGRLRIPRALVVVGAGALAVVAIAAAVIALAGGSEAVDQPAAIRPSVALTQPSAPRAEPSTSDCVTLWNQEEDAARHQIAAAFGRIGDARVRVRRSDGRCSVTISSALAGRALRFTQDDTGVFGAFGPPEVLAEAASGRENARLRADGTLR
jgi:hypothetical protein